MIEFTQDTINKNNSEYNKYLHFNKSDSGKVAWCDKFAQNKNFNLVANYIDNGDSLLDYGCGIGDFRGFLSEMNIQLVDYLGIDINNNYINLARKKYPNDNFELITDSTQLSKWDVICAIGVFTWYIKKDEFISIIKKLYSLSNKYLLITLLDAHFLGTPYDKKEYTQKDEDLFWSSQYRTYNEKLFYELFPEFGSKLSFDYFGNTILIKINK